ncbi:hypothetical protein O6H91_07G029400 [Diphasiastrum complanatum]|uniref:Uncharacterized protein n=1 Tax=Diphasiastrum complanatum TaxID=34168 RepID=A0ACC2D4C8_DIPCM|nr:hypothetical protein O6H91_07G029400 [Diphasiastrum complanatum]
MDDARFGADRHVPPGIAFLRRVRKKDLSFRFYQTSVLVITFFAYSSYHASRKPISIVKSVLDPEIPDLKSTVNETHLFVPRPMHLIHRPIAHFSSFNTSDHSDFKSATNDFRTLFVHPAARSHASALLFMHRKASSSPFADGLQSGWAPFNGTLGKSRLGEIDLAFLASYAIGMYFAGHLGDRLDLRLFLTLGMIFSGVFVCLFGLGYWLKIHSLYYYVIIQILGGIFQATGWPSVVAVVANWFDKSKRGLIMGIWNSHTSVGNIVGSLLAGAVLQHGWGWSFMLPGLTIIAAACIVFLFLVVEPSKKRSSPTVENGSIADVLTGERGLPVSNDEIGLCIEMTKTSIVTSEISGSADVPDISLTSNGKEGMEKPMSEFKEMGVVLVNGEEERRLLIDHEDVLVSADSAAVGFFEAWAIPGVYQFAFCLFFSKLVAYTFLYWLPFYIRHNKIANEYLSDKAAGNLSTLFDVGGVLGGILAGIMSDKLNARALTTSVFIYCSIPALIVYHFYGGYSFYGNIGLMMLLGIFVNGPYALITTAVSADLGTHSSLKGNARALATVTAIIDGTGSVGAAIGPLLTGYISQKGWTAVFIMLILAALIAGLSLLSLVYDEIFRKSSMTRVSEVVKAPENG